MNESRHEKRSRELNVLLSCLDTLRSIGTKELCLSYQLYIETVESLKQRGYQIEEFSKYNPSGIRIKITW